MKAAVNKITEGAKLRDTIGRNQCPVIDVDDMSASELVEALLGTQIVTSSDNVEKITNVLIYRRDKVNILLKFRALYLTNVNTEIAKSFTSKVEFKILSKKEGDEENDK